MIQARRVLVIGGARSGKSRHAVRLAEESGLERIFVATAQGFDEEMRSRIARHRLDRSAGWRTVEAPLQLSEAIAAETGRGRVVLVDCLTLWLSNVMLTERDPDADAAALETAVAAASGPLLLVSNEVGTGIVPPTALGRRFRDAQGRLNQAVASLCDTVILVTAGCSLLLKPAPAPKIALG